MSELNALQLSDNLRSILNDCSLMNNTFIFSSKRYVKKMELERQRVSLIADIIDQAIRVNERILKYDSIVLTPHFAFNSNESFEELREKVVLSAIKVLKGELPFNVVNKKNLI